MPLQIVRNDITKMKVDAIVNAANTSLLGGGGVDGCIHRAAGPALLAECRTLGGCATGSAKLTGAGNLPCRYVIHAVGPRWSGGGRGEREKLVSCYRTALALAEEKGCQSIAFPLISSGIYGYPKDQALRVAVETIGDYVLKHDMLVYLVIFGRNDYRIDEKLFADLAARMYDTCADAGVVDKSEHRRPESLFRRGATVLGTAEAAAPAKAARKPAADRPAPSSLQEAIDGIDESFSEMLLRKIDESGMTDAACYKKANIDRKLFSKIRSDRLYKPSKTTAIAFAIALELPMAETADLLRKAGFALSPASKFDIIIRYFIERGEYDIFAINEALFAFDQSLLGA